MRFCGEARGDASHQERPVATASGQKMEERLARLEALATAVERWLADPRYVTEQMMIKALREVSKLGERKKGSL